MPPKIRVGRSENFFCYLFKTSDRYHDHHAWSTHRESWYFYWFMNTLTAFLVLNWSFWALVSLLIVQTLAKFLHKHTSPCRFPLAFPLTDSDTIKSVRVGGKNQGRSGNRKQRYFLFGLIVKEQVHMNVLYQVCVLRSNASTKMAGMSSDLLIFFLLLCNCWMGFEKTYQEASTQVNVLYHLCFLANLSTKKENGTVLTCTISNSLGSALLHWYKAFCKYCLSNACPLPAPTNFKEA